MGAQRTRRIARAPVDPAVRAGPPTVPALDGVRLLAFLAVFVFHAFQSNDRLDRIVGYGALGVQIFFVLSGFLIGSGLLALRDASDLPVGTRLRTFYARRALRIFPLYYMTLALLLLLEFVGIKSVGGSGLLGWNATYLTNVKFFLDGHLGGGLSHLWSLAVEEHFYLVAPLLVLSLTTRTLSWLCVATCVAAAVARVGFWVRGEELGWILSPLQFDCMMVGIAAAILQADGRFLGVSRRVAMRVSLWALIAAVPILSFRQWDGRVAELIGQSLENVVLSVAVAGMIVFLWNSVASRSSRLLTVRPLPYLGKISYGLYMFHLPCLVLASVWFGFLRSGTALPALAMTIGLAALSWRFVEGPVNAQKRRFPLPRAGMVTTTSSAGAGREP